MEAYVQSVRSRGGKEFAAIYPIMLRILQAASGSPSLWFYGGGPVTTGASVLMKDK